MPYTMEEFIQQAEKRLILGAPVEMRLAGLTPEQLRTALTPEQLLEGVTPEQRLQGVTPEQVIQQMTPEDREKFRKLLETPPPSA